MQKAGSFFLFLPQIFVSWSKSPNIMRNRLFILFLFLGAQIGLFAQSPDAPDSFLGYKIGDRFTPHYRVVDYYEHLAQAYPERVQLIRYGKTYEQRELLAAVISAPENMANLEQIRQDHLADAGFGDGAAEGKIPIVWISFNVHGNEASGTEAALDVIWDLLAKPEAQVWLRKMVVILDPCLNPDGRERYVNWYHQMLGVQPNVNPNAREHNEGWPNGRPNHYMFDLNRDWVWGTQIETRQRVKLYQEWLPHVHADVHEMDIDEPYFFPPAAEPVHAAITPWQRTFQTHIAQNHSRYFDQMGWRYFTSQTFDLFYPGYGDTFPMFNGAIGMTYEKGGGGQAGLQAQTREGNILTLFDRKEQHRMTVLSTFETAYRDADKLLSEFRKFYQPESHQAPFQNVVIRSTNADAKSDLLRLLNHNGIFVRQVAQNHSLMGFRYSTRKNERVTVEAGDLLVSLKQPKSVLTRVLFEANPALSDSLTYDITGWALPYAYAVDAIATSETVPSVALSVTENNEMPKEGYAYILPWNSFSTAKALAKLLKENIKVHFSKTVVKTEGQTFPIGSLIIFKQINNERLSPNVNFGAYLNQIAGASFIPLSSGRTSPELGSSSVGYLKSPKVALLAGRPSLSLGVGEVWHYFDEELQFPITLIRPEDFAGIDWEAYDILILADGRYSAFLNDTNWQKIKSWVERGGKLITIEGAVDALVGKSGISLKSIEAEGSNAPQQFDQKDRIGITDSNPGAIFEVQVDRTHPLGYGLPATYFAISQSANLYQPNFNGWTVGKYTAQPVVSGFVGSALKARWGNSFAFGVEEMGGGQVVLLKDNPLFRGFWYGGKLLFANAVFMAGN